MHFSHTAVTDKGNEMLNEMMAGRLITLTKAEGGAGKTESPDSNLKALTKLEGDVKQALTITDDIVDETGRSIPIQVTNADTSYSLSQIGVYAKLTEVNGNTIDGQEETLFFVLQDDDPITIPDKTAPTFILDLYAHLHINNETGRFVVEIDKTGIASLEYVERKIKEHNDDIHAHLLKDDSHQENLFRLGVDNGHLYITEVEASE